MCVRERERESVCVCVYVCASFLIRSYSPFGQTLSYFKLHLIKVVSSSTNLTLLLPVLTNLYDRDSFLRSGESLKSHLKVLFSFFSLRVIREFRDKLCSRCLA